VRRAIFALLAVAALATPAAAEEPDDRLKDVERELSESRHRSDALTREAEALAGETARLRLESVEAAKTAQNLESSLTAMETEIAKLDERETAMTRALDAERDRLARLLAAMERIARHPPAAFLAERDRPADAVRGAILLRASVPAVEDRARALGAELQDLAAIRAELANRRVEAEEAARALDSEMRRIAALGEEKSKFERRARAESKDEARRAAELAAQAESLRDLLARIEAGRKAMPAPKPGARTHAARILNAPREENLPLPARGDIVLGFGDEDSSGGRTRGLTIKTRERAQVVAPADGEVVFAGPFRGYGQLLIIAAGAEYHALLGGLDRIDAEVGQSVLAGEPVGTMPGSPKGTPNLYFELRRKGQPINPLPWLAAGNSKVNG
jgi:murein hydrolase activator